MTYAQMYSPKIIQTKCTDVKISQKQRESAKEWLELLKNGTLKEEKANYPNFMHILLRDLLEYPEKEISYEAKNVEFSFKNKNKETAVCFEAKGTKTEDLFAYQGYNKKEQENPVIQTLSNMARFPARFGVATNYRKFILLDLHLGNTKCHKFDFYDIENNDDKLKEFIKIFSYNSLVESTDLDDLYDASITEEKEFTNEFYKLFHETRLMLIKEFQENTLVSRTEAINITQLFLNRLIFMFFVEDRGFISDERLFTNRILKLLDSDQSTEHSKKVYAEITELFIAFDKGDKGLGVFGFNGGLFSGVFPDKISFSDRKDPNFFSDVKLHSKLLKSTKLNEKDSKIIDKQKQLNPIIYNLLLMDSFDFAPQTISRKSEATQEVSINILGHIFEQSISDLEELKQIGVSRRKKEGVYYTPQYITDYICRNTIIPYLSKSNVSTVHELINEYFDDIKELEKKFSEIKILDPACGSGAFLVKAIDILLEIHKEIQIVKESTGKYSTGGQFQLTKWNEEEEIKNIIENNIYGVDINGESIGITQLSLFLKLASNHRKLSGLSKNIKVGNSLIDDENVDARAFDWNKEFPIIFYDPHLKNSENELHLSTKFEDGFDIVIGNPPYGAEISETQKKYFKDNFQSATGRYDSYFYFIERSISFLKNHGVLGFIVPDTWLTNVHAKKLRKNVLDNCCIQQIIGLPQNIFVDATVDTCLFIIKKEINEKIRLKNKIDVFVINKNIQIRNINDEVFQTKASVLQERWTTDKRNLFTIFTINENDSSIDKIKENTVNLGSITEMRRGVFCYRKSSLVKEYGDEKGTEILEKRLWHSDHKVDKDYKKELLGSDINRFKFEWLNKKWFRYGKHIASYVEPRFFETDYIAVQRIRNPALKRRLIATIIKSGNEFYASSGLTSIILSDRSYSIYYLLALINSTLLNWYFKQFFRDVNIKPEDLRELPIKKINDEEQKQFIELVQQIIKLNESLNEFKHKFIRRVADNFNLRIDSKFKNFEKLIFKEFLHEFKKQQITLTLEKQDEWEEYFNEKKIGVQDLEKEINQLDDKINEMVYNIYGLSNDEIMIIEKELNS